MFRKKSDVHTLIMEQIKDVEKCLFAFESFMEAATTPETNPETLIELVESVKDTEFAADKSLRAMIDSLSDGAYLPSTREDIISIGTSCDKIANKCEYVAKTIVFQRFDFPEEFSQDIVDILSITKQQFEILEDAIGMLFQKMSALQKDTSILDKIRALETDVDHIEDKINTQIFQMNLALAEKMQVSHIVEHLCDLSDIIEDIADKIQIMLIARKA
ncbi:MAG: DUF47 family protein [Oscillospiraceae bacterium]|nr:DUF47 family protein [Oscillospiraceae bacterium]